MPDKMRMKLLEQLAERGINAGKSAGPELRNTLALTHMTSTGNLTT